MSARRLFVTGTDTDVGKTVASVALLRALAQRGLQTAALKPVAAGVDASGQNTDALLLQRHTTLHHPYALINPVLLREAIAPHIAAAKEGIELSVTNTLALCKPVLSARADVVVIEGAGGWAVPLNSRETMSDLAQAMRAEVILVVAVRLGCLNHALLTAAAIERDGLVLGGWVANYVDANMAGAKQNVETLRDRIAAPLLAELPNCAAPESMNLADCFGSTALSGYFAGSPRR